MMTTAVMIFVTMSLYNRIISKINPSKLRWEQNTAMEEIKFGITVDIPEISVGKTMWNLAEYIYLRYQYYFRG
jgi:hypothetical protein